MQIPLILACGLLFVQAPPTPQVDAPTTYAPSTYALGPDDQIIITALDLDEVTTKTPIRIDSRGMINLPLVGRLKVSGLTPQQLENEI